VRHNTSRSKPFEQSWLLIKLANQWPMFFFECSCAFCVIYHTDRCVNIQYKNGCFFQVGMTPA
jgi:hypothetical protein